MLGSGRFLDIRTGYLDLESGSVVRMELDSDFFCHHHTLDVVPSWLKLGGHLDLHNPDTFGLVRYIQNMIRASASVQL